MRLPIVRSRFADSAGSSIRFDEGGVVIALELSLGAIVAGPFNIAERDLSVMIQNVMDAEAKVVSRGCRAATPRSRRIH